MPQGHVILLANFYGSYLKKNKFRATVIVNNAGIEQLATLGVEKIKEVKANASPHDGIYVLIVAGLTDVLIKSVEEGKNKLEITPNSTQLLDTKMQWAHSLLTSEGAKIIWAIMPPISLRMYHLSEGWNINKIPGMSGGLDREQRALNNLMFNYRNLCMKLNYFEARKICNGPFFTDMVSELAQDRGSMNLITGYFESDGISPTTKLVENWTQQVDKIFLAIEKLFTSRSRTPPRSRSPPKLMHGVGNGDSWDLPPPRERNDERSEHSLKRPYDDFHSARGLHGLGSGALRQMDKTRKLRDEAYDNYSSQSGVDLSSSSKVPSLLDMPNSRDQPRRNLDNPGISNFIDPQSKEVATAVQLLAATMQLGGANAGDMQSVLSALISQKKDSAAEGRLLEEERVKRRIEDERAALVKQEEVRRLAEIKRIEENRREEARYREEMRRREEDRRREERLLEEKRIIEARRRREEEERLRQAAAHRRAAEDQRLREIQIAAKLAMEQQKRDEERQRQVKLMQDQQAQLALMAVTSKVREQIAQKKAEVAAYNVGGTNLKPNSALDRINEKLKNDREKKDNGMKFDKKIANDPLWAAPVVLFSFVNRSNEKRPLRGILGQKVARSSSKAADVKSRGQWIYNEPGAPPLSTSLLKIQLKRPGQMSEFETKVADYNNRLLEMMDEADCLIQEGRAQDYIIRRECDEPKSTAKAGGSSSIADKVVKQESKPANSTSLGVESSSGKTSVGKVRDLRESLNRSSRRCVRSKSPSQPKKEPSNATAARRSTETKPRWDKSDESEEELLWEDDHVSVKVVPDDDDVQIVEEHDVKEKSKTNAQSSTSADIEKKVDNSSNPASTVVNSDNFVTQDEGNHADDNAENFLTIDETA